MRFHNFLGLLQFTVFLSFCCPYTLLSLRSFFFNNFLFGGFLSRFYFCCFCFTFLTLGFIRFLFLPVNKMSKHKLLRISLDIKLLFTSPNHKQAIINLRDSAQASILLYNFNQHIFIFCLVSFGKAGHNNINYVLSLECVDWVIQ